jgi:hypothetical protein
MDIKGRQGLSCMKCMILRLSTILTGSSSPLHVEQSVEICRTLRNPSPLALTSPHISSSPRGVLPVHGTQVLMVIIPMCDIPPGRIFLLLLFFFFFLLVRTTSHNLSYMKLTPNILIPVSGASLPSFLLATAVFCPLRCFFPLLPSEPLPWSH